MFFTLLLVTFLTALGVSFLVARFFDTPINGILRRIVPDDISAAWVKYMKFAVYVVGISRGVRIWELERYITPMFYPEGEQILSLTNERWVLELYRTVIGTLQGIAWLLLVSLVFALIAYVIVRAFELKHKARGE